MKVYLLGLIVILSLGLASEVIGQSDSTQLSQKQQMKLRGYIGGVYERSSVSPIHTNSFGFQAAILIKNHFQFGFYGKNHTYHNYREQLIFPNFFQMNYKHAGLLIGYRTHLEKKYEFNLESKFGMGEVKWNELETGNPYLADKFRIFHLQMSVDYLLTKFLAVNGFAGYRWIGDLDITGLSNADFEGLYYGIVVKLGIFK